MENNNRIPNQRKKNGMTIREVIDLMWRLRYWIAASTAVCLIFGFFYVHIQNPVYQRSACVMLNNESSTGGEMSVASELMGFSSNKRIDNEMFILQSSSLMEKVVEKLGLNTRYYHYTMPVADRIRICRGLFCWKQEEYYKDNPFSLTFSVDPLYPSELHPTSFGLAFKNIDSETFAVRSVTLNGKKQHLDESRYKYGDVVALPGCTFKLEIIDASEMINRDKYYCSWELPYNVAKEFAANLKTDIQLPVRSRQSDVLMASLTDAKAGRAEDILNTLIVTANDEAHNYSNSVALNTIKFIDQRLSAISNELSDAESDFKSYQRSNTVIDLSTQSQASIQVDRQNQAQLDEVNLQLKLLEMVTESINADANGKYSIIPANIGVTDAGLNGIIANYNTMVAERNRMVANSSESNPRVLSLNTQLSDLRQSIEVSITNLTKMYHIRQRELERTLQLGKSRLADIPQQQFEMQQFNRRLGVIEPLYLLLQQKREEAQIQMYSQMDNFRLIEPANGSDVPVSPIKMRIYLLALILGCFLPVIVVRVRMQLRTTVDSKKDVKDHIQDASVLAVIPRCEDTEGMLIKRNGRDAMSESFRNLRTNLRYFSGTKVIQVTSSISGEGKTFIASNLALSIAHLERRVLLIGLDIRMPRLDKFFPNNDVNNANTVVGYLLGECCNPDLLVNHTVESPYLDIIYAGPVPPNPTELLSQGRAADIISYFRDRYDYIVLDSAPLMPVSDSLLINEYADTTIYTIRAGKTPLAMLDDVNEIVHDTTRPIKRVSFVLNDFDLTSSKYHSGSNSGYGYGYGYGDDGKKRKLHCRKAGIR